MTDLREALPVLIAFAEGRIQHRNWGDCADGIEGHDSRDPKCEVCQAIIHGPALLAAVRDGERLQFIVSPDRPVEQPHVCFTPDGEQEWFSAHGDFARELIDAAMQATPEAEHET